MAARDLLRILAAGRVALGTGMVVAPVLTARPLGRGIDTGGARVLGRALGVRDAVLGGMLLHTLDHPQVARRWIATCAACDLVDGLAAVRERDDLPRAGALLFAGIALGSAAAHAALASSVSDDTVAP